MKEFMNFKLLIILLQINQRKMQMLGKINAMLEKGWKMTDVTCPNCNGTTMAEPKEQIEVLYCPKQDKQYPFEFEQLTPDELDQNKQQEEEDQQKFFQKVTQEMKEQKKQQAAINNKIQDKQYANDQFYLNQKEVDALKRTNDVSKKIGEKLLQGWTMLNQSCNDCYAPIMRSKKGEKICFGCNRDVTQKQESKVEAPKPVIIQPIQPKVEEPKKQEIPKEKNVKPIQPKLIETKEYKTEFSKPCSNDKVEKKASQKNAHTHIFDRIEEKALIFLQDKLQKAIEDEELAQMQKILKLVYKIKNEFK